MPDPIRAAVDQAQSALDTKVAEAIGWLQRNPHATTRELDVLALVAQGLNNQHIADRLNISVETVKAYLTQLTRRWGCSGRAHLVATAYQLGHLKTRGRT